MSILALELTEHPVNEYWGSSQRGRVKQPLSDAEVKNE
jgi:hypothetical protein